MGDREKGQVSTNPPGILKATRLELSDFFNPAEWLTRAYYRLLFNLLLVDYSSQLCDNSNIEV